MGTSDFHFVLLIAFMSRLNCEVGYDFLYGDYLDISDFCLYSSVIACGVVKKNSISNICLLIFCFLLRGCPGEKE